MIISILEQSLILGIMVLGVYITYRVLDFPDLSTDGTFPLGAAVVAVLLIKGISPLWALLIAGLAGAIAGAITGILHTKLKITNLLSGILVMTGLYSVNLRIMGKSNIHLFNVKHIFNMNILNFRDSGFIGENIKLVILGIILIVITTLLALLFKTKYGFILRALGDNENLVSSLGVDEKLLKISGLAIGNALIAISGGLFAQFQGFADVSMGTGIVIVGLASIILGELVCGKMKIISPLIAILVGGILYRTVIAVSLDLGLNASDLKLLTSLIIITIIGTKVLTEKIRKGR